MFHYQIRALHDIKQRFLPMDSVFGGGVADAVPDIVPILENSLARIVPKTAAVARNVEHGVARMHARRMKRPLQARVFNQEIVDEIVAAPHQSE